MATDDATITGTFDDQTFQFYIDGVATHRQMDKLLDKVDALLKKFKAQDLEENRAEKERKKERELIEATNTLRGKESDALEKRIDVENVLNRALSLQSSGIRGLLQPLDRTAVGLSLMSAGLYGVIGGFKNLLDYSVHVGAALQMGIGGGVMDFAVSAKTAGLNLTDFTKALQESGGGFAQLGSNATEGSRQFANLVREVRTATGAIGNLGMTNEQLAVFTAQQLKVAVGQGMRGRRAQEFVIQNTREFGKELDELASKTGKSVVELAQAAMKVGMNPVIASFVRDAGSMGGKVSTAAQKAVASFSAIFGERGAKIAEDAIQSAMSGLPFIVTKSGQDLFTIASGVATEMERQAQKTARGEEITEADRERLRQIVLAETKARGHELRQLASLPGPLQESAKQLLELSKDAQYYNTEEGKRDRKKAEASKKFMEESNKLKATLQELAIPFLQLLNGIDWAGIFSVFSALLKGVQIVLTPLAAVGKFLGDTGLGGLLAALITLGTVVGGTILVFKNLKYALEIFGGLGKGLGGLFGKKAGDRVTDGITGKKERGSILDIFGGKSQDVSIVGGVGTNPARPLFVYIVGGNKGRRGTGPAAPGGPLGGPLDDVLGDGAERRSGPGYRKGAKERLRELRKEGLSPAEARRKYEMEQRGAAAGGQVRDFFKNNKLALLSGAAIITGGFASMYAEKALAEDPESTSGKIASVIAPVLEYGGALAGTFDLINRFAPNFADSLKTWGSRLLETVPSMTKLGTGLKGALPALTKFGTGLLTVAAPFMAGFAIDAIAGQIIGKVSDEERAKLNKQDDKNWEKMSLWEKTQSSLARGIEHLGRAFFLGNLADKAAKTRIEKESKYLEEKSPEGKRKKQAEETALASDRKLLKQLADEGSIKEDFFKKGPVFGVKSLEELNGADAKKNTSTVKPDGTRTERKEFSFSEAELAKKDEKLYKEFQGRRQELFDKELEERKKKLGPNAPAQRLQTAEEMARAAANAKAKAEFAERAESVGAAKIIKTSQIATPTTDAGKSKRLDVYESLSKSEWQKSSATLPEFEKTATGVQSAQVAAIDQEKSKAAQDKQSSSKMVELLTDLKSINEAALGVQAKGVSVADSSNKFLRDQKVLGWTGPAA